MLLCDDTHVGNVSCCGMAILYKESGVLKRPCNNDDQGCVNALCDTETSSSPKKAKIDLGDPPPDETSRKDDTPPRCGPSINLPPSVTGPDHQLLADAVPDQVYAKHEEQSAVSDEVDSSLHT